MRTYATGKKVSGIALSPDGTQLAFTDKLSVSLLQVDSLAIYPRIFSSNVPVFSEKDLVVLDMHFSPNGQYLVISYSDGTIRQWDVGTGLVSSPIMRTTDVSGYFQIDISPDGQYVIATATRQNGNSVFDIWYIPTGSKVDRVTSEWSSFLKPYLNTRYSLPSYTACFNNSGSPHIIINDYGLTGLSRIFEFPTFENLVERYRVKLDKH